MHRFSSLFETKNIQKDKERLQKSRSICLITFYITHRHIHKTTLFVDFCKKSLDIIVFSRVVTYIYVKFAVSFFLSNKFISFFCFLNLTLHIFCFRNDVFLNNCFNNCFNKFFHWPTERIPPAAAKATLTYLTTMSR